MKTCGHCLRYIEMAALSCPFCATPSRADRAPGWYRLALVSLAFGLTSACVEGDPGNDDDADDSTSTSAGMTGNATAVSSSNGNTSSPGTGPGTSTTTTGPGGETTLDDDDAGEGSTYAGPDEDSSTWGDSTTVWPDTDTDTETTTSATSESTTFDGDTEESSGSAG